MALGAALIWSASVVLFKRVDDLPPTAVNLFKNSAAILFLALTLLSIGVPLFDWRRSSSDWLVLIGSGIVGIAVADSLFFAALSRMGAGSLAVVECAYSPFVVLTAVVLLGERVGPSFAIGALLVVAGVLIVSIPRKGLSVAGDRTRFARGVAYSVGAVSLMALAIVVAKPALERSNLIEVTFVRLVAGNVALGLFVSRNAKARREALAIFRPQRCWRFLVPAAFMGSYVAMILWVGGMKFANASVAGVLNQLSTVFTIAMSRLFLGEPLTRQRLAGGSAAMAGAMLIIFAPF
ncbi:MAG: DMT family transporter [Myxococcales bacterium]|nr:DMT family transporter [Myxococcales bacterium]